MHRRMRIAVAAAVASVTFLAGLLTWSLVGRDTEPARDQAPARASTSSIDPDQPAAGQTDRPRPGAPVKTRSGDLAANRDPEQVPPTRLRVPAIGLDLPVQPDGVDEAGAMALPTTVDAVSWYRFGPAPLDQGSTVIAGHVDTRSEGIGPLARLERLGPGDTFTVVLGDTEVDYRVDAVREVSKSLVDLDALFARTGPRRLQLITCAGAYDRSRGGYQANLVVSATPTN
ncbi:MAG: class F sortase [Nocardioides sp.]